MAARRFRDLPRVEVLGAEFPVAVGGCARLLGLALLDRRSVGPGLVIPGCRSVHTFGMRFPLDVYFLGSHGEMVSVRRAVRPGQVLFHRDAIAVLEVPSEDGAQALRGRLRRRGRR